MNATWYRYDFTCYAAPLDEFDRPCGRGSVEVNLREYQVLKETPCGVWLDIGLGEKRFVLRDSKRQFASPSAEAAKDKFIRRKQRHIAILLHQVETIREALAKVGAQPVNQKEITL